MIDYVQVKVSGYDANSLMSHPKLNFGDSHDCETHEVFGVARAYYKGLKFSVTPTNQLFVDGSIHKYINSGHHNHDRFTLDSLEWVLNDLCSEFSFSPSDCIIENLEFGVNLRGLPIATQQILNGLIAFKNRRFYDKNYKDGQYRHAPFKQYEFKAYDKGKQYKLSESVCRLETKYKKSQKLRSIAPTCKTLNDLRNPKVISDLSGDLISAWDNVLIYDITTNSNDLEFVSRCNGNYWEYRSQMIGSSSKGKYYGERKRFKEQAAKESPIHQVIADSMKQELGSFYPIYCG